jgi:hypothetical protein
LTHRQEPDPGGNYVVSSSPSRNREHVVIVVVVVIVPVSSLREAGAPGEVGAVNRPASAVSHAGSKEGDWKLEAGSWKL